MRQYILSLHDTWIRWAAFERHIVELQNNPDGVLQYQAYNRDSGKIDTPETLSYRADTIVLIPGLYNLTDFHKEIDYQLNVAFTTTVAEGMRRERAELQQIGRRSESEIEAVIRNVYLPMRLRIQRSLADRDIHPSLEVDVTPNMPAVPINKRGEIEWSDPIRPDPDPAVLLVLLIGRSGSGSLPSSRACCATTWSLDGIGRWRPFRSSRHEYSGNRTKASSCYRYPSKVFVREIAASGVLIARYESYGHEYGLDAAGLCQ